MNTILSVVLAAFAGAGLPCWTFDKDTEGWVPNDQLKEVAVRDGILHCRAVDNDPMFILDKTEFAATPWQYVTLRVKADRDGQGELFWTGQTTGQYGGFSAEKSTRFGVVGDGQFHTVTLFPFWQAEGAIRRLRLDLYDATEFEIDTIQVGAWGDGKASDAGSWKWQFNGDMGSWKVGASDEVFYAPPLNATVTGRNWATVMAKSENGGSAELLWATSGTRGAHGARFDVLPSARPLPYTIELNGLPEWQDKLVALGLRVPGKDIEIESVVIAAKPQGPAWLVVDYLGAENAENRVGAPRTVMARIRNRGGAPSEAGSLPLALGPHLKAEGALDQALPRLDPDAVAVLRWKVVADEPGEQEVFVRLPGQSAARAVLAFVPPVAVAKADYVPVPKPLATSMDVCAYYFPGWEADTKWDCIRNVAPNRKPALGYYDEAKTECVDWQIKWAVENGISCFFVDWYWSAGQQMLTHWFDAYRQAKYRDMLKVAIMWANHNGPGTHSAEDWRAVTKHWIEQYFTLPSYYKVGGKPLIMIWAPENLQRDLGSPEAVKKALDESQEMARKAGYPGIFFVAMNDPVSESRARTLAQEGYSAVTTYHEWGEHAPSAMATTNRMSYEQLVKDAPRAWEEKTRAAKPLEYWPVVDTGWDPRPWHGAKSFVIEGRTPALFQDLVTQACNRVLASGRQLVVLGPLNEWGEGSYIEPCAEYGFAMYEAVAKIFAKDPKAVLATNLFPSDVGRGPYDFVPKPPVTAWKFDTSDSGWKAMMGVGPLGTGEGGLKFITTSEDPAIMAATYGVDAAANPRMSIVMQIEGNLPERAFGQLFWASERDTASEATSISFPLARDGKPHEYKLDLASKPRWRGHIATLRLDPCATQGVTVTLKSVRFTK